MVPRFLIDLAGTLQSVFRIQPSGSSGAPSTGYHYIGEIAMDADGVPWRCTVAGTPGTWVSMAGGSGTVTGSGTSGKIAKFTGASAIGDATNTDSEVASSVSLKHTQGTDTALGALGTKNPPIDADKLIYRDSAASDGLVTSTFTQIKAFLKTYLDTLYSALGHTHSYISSALTSAHILVGNGSNVATDVAVSGDITMANTGAVSVNKVIGHSGQTISAAALIYAHQNFR